MLLRLSNGICFLIFLTNITARNVDRNEFLSTILSKKNGPVVVFLERSSADDDDDLPSNFRGYPDQDSLESASSYQPAPGENDAYLLYNVLRTTEQDEDLDSKALRMFEKTKSVLREAFALRCQKKQTCEKKCPPKKPACPAKCQQVFDELDVCDEPKPKCNSGPKCGKTMPPRWLRMLIKG